MSPLSPGVTSTPCTSAISPHCFSCSGASVHDTQLIQPLCCVSISLQSEFLKERGTYTLSMEYFKATFIPELYIRFLLPLSCCLIILCYSSAYINDQLLGNNISINIMAYNRRHYVTVPVGQESGCGLTGLLLQSFTRLPQGID